MLVVCCPLHHSPWGPVQHVSGPCGGVVVWFSPGAHNSLVLWALGSVLSLSVPGLSSWPAHRHVCRYEHVAYGDVM